MNLTKTAYTSAKSYVKQQMRNLQKVYFQKRIDTRIRNKIIAGKQIRVLFICHNPTMWGALKTVYEALEKDPFFEISIVSIPQRNLSENNRFEDIGADNFFGKYNAIRGYNYDTNEFVELFSLEPDIVFFQQPYDGIRIESYSSKAVVKYAKIAYISYFTIVPNVLSDMTVFDVCFPEKFFERISYFFAQNKGEELYVQKKISKNKWKGISTYLTGHPKYDGTSAYSAANSAAWNFPEENDHFRILWTPRWSTNENNCHFFTYKDNWLSYCLANENVDFIFRPHPQSWIEWRTTGEFTEKDQQEFRLQYSSMNNMSIDESGDYLEMLYSSDCLVSDMSSMVFQYLLTEKPIIFCHNPQSINSILKDTSIGEALYYAETWEEVERYLDMLRQGEDPLKTKRKEIIQSEFNFDKDITAGEKVKDAIKASLLNLAYDKG